MKQKDPIPVVDKKSLQEMIPINVNDVDFDDDSRQGTMNVRSRAHSSGDIVKAGGARRISTVLGAFGIETEQLHINQVNAFGQEEINNISIWDLARHSYLFFVPVFIPGTALLDQWDLTMIVCLFYVAIFAPLQMSYFSEIHNWNYPERWLFLFVVDRIVDVLFLVDIIITFRTSWKTEDNYMRYNEWKAIKKYVGTCRKGPGWFWIDILSIIPFNALALMKNNFVRPLRMLKMFKLIRVFKSIKIYARVEKILARKLGYSTLRLLAFTLALIFFSHILSCLLYLVYQQGQEQGHTTWLHVYDETHTYRSDYKDRIVDVYCIGFYWGMMTLTTVGYGDITAQNTGERMFFSVVMLCSTFVFAYVLGNVCDLINSQNAQALEFQKNEN